MSTENRKKIIRLLGVGFDAEDGHVRITQGGGHDIYMGSEECHEYLQTLCTRIEENLADQGKRLEDIPPESFGDFIRDLI